MQYRVLFIDWDGTLSRSRFWERWRDNPENRSSYDLLQNVLFNNDKGKILLQDWMIGVKSYSDVINYVSSITDIPYEDLKNELQFSAENMKLIDADIIKLIKKIISQGIKVVIATDNMDTFTQWTVPAMRLRLLFDEILVSDNIGAMKTQVSPEGLSLFFDDYLRRHDIKTNQSVLIDDNLNTQAVEQWGINFLHVDDASPLSAHLRQILQDIHESYEVHTLAAAKHKHNE